jgi:hypothetical protein
LSKNEDGSGSEQVQYRPSKELLSSEEFFALLRFENRGKLEDLETKQTSFYLQSFNQIPPSKAIC